MEELGDFLRSRRSRLSPPDAGVRAYGERRRVPGLRREELAQLAGVSVAYYTRLEQGLSTNASDGVLDALARALRLDADETAHLNALAHPPRAAHAVTGPRQRQERVRPSVATMLAALGDAPAILVGYRNDVLGWNPMGHALLFGHLPFDAPGRPETRPNTFRLIFCDPHTRELYADWKKKAQDAVADLRLLSGRYPGDPRLTSLIGELSRNSQEFARLWAVHPVRQCRAIVRGFRHPLVGALTLNSEVMEFAQDTGQRLFIYTAEPDSPSDAGLRLLAALTAENAAITALCMAGVSGAGRCVHRPAGGRLLCTCTRSSRMSFGQQRVPGRSTVKSTRFRRSAWPFP
jgi:transcriptional regulator with XRE-family HTH domain